MRLKLQVPLGEFAPDDKERDTTSLERTVNLIPVFNSYRTIPALRTVSSQPSKFPITGSLAHLVTSSAAVQIQAPSNWILTDDAGQEVGDWIKSDIEKAVWELLKSPNDGSKLTAVGGTLGGQETPGELKGALNVITDPGTSVGWKFELRYRIIEPDNIAQYNIPMAYADRDTGFSLAPIGQEGRPVGQTGPGEFVVVQGDIPTETIDVIRSGDNLEQAAFLITPFYDIDLNAEFAYKRPIAEIYAVGGWVIWDEESTLQFWEILALESTPTATDDEHILVAELAPNAEYHAELEEVDPTAGVGTDWILSFYLAKHAAADPDVKATLSLNLPDGTEVASTVVTVTTDTPALHDLTFTQPQWDLVTSGVGLQSRLKAESNAAGGGLQTLRPDSTKNAGDFAPVGGATLHAVTSDEDLDTYALSAIQTDGQKFRVGLPTPVATPPDGTEVKVSTIVSNVGGPRIDMKLRFGSASTTHKTWSRTAIFGQDKEISGSTSPTGVDWTDAWVEVEFPWIGQVGYQGQVQEIWVEAEGSDPTGVRYYRTFLQQPPTGGLEISHFRVLAPLPGEVTPGDEVRVYAGTQESIYDISEAGYIDVSKTEDKSYNQTGLPRAFGSWVFASWGDRVVATDGANPIQYQDGFGTRFIDLLDTVVEPETETPLARYLAVVKDQLVLGNVYLASDPTNFNEYTLWYSKINNPRVFKILDLSGQSDYQNLVATPGEITWIVGGEHGTVFKRNSIYSMRYIGLPYLYDVSVIADNQGTYYGRSVVKIGDDQFFFGAGGFQHLPYGDRPRSIGDGIITRMFIDTLYEDRAIYRVASADRREDEATIFGRYDPWSQQIYWIYRRVVSPAFQSIFGLTYNPKEDKWSELSLNETLCELISIPNTPTLFEGLMRSVFGFSWDGAELTSKTFSGGRTLQAKVVTKALSSRFFMGEKGIHRNSVLHGFRPIATIHPPIVKELPNQPVDYGIRVTGGQDQAMTGRGSTTDWIQYVKNANADGWLMFGNPVSGEFFRFDITVPELEGDSIRDIEGYELDVEVGGQD